MEAFQEKEIVFWSAEDLGGNSEHLGLSGSPTQTRRVYVHKIERGEIQYLEGETEEMARKLMDILKQENLL